MQRIRSTAIASAVASHALGAVSSGSPSSSPSQSAHPPSTSAAFATAKRPQSTAQYPAEGSMHTPGTSAADGDMEGGGTEGKETWSQYSARMRHGRRRMRTVDVAARSSYEFRMLKLLCRKRPTMRQWAIRDDMCIMDPGVVFMSPSMQSAYMRVFRMKSKGEVRAALRDIIPVIMYRNSLTHAPEKYFKAEELIPKDEADTLNQKKRELFERKTSIDKYTDVTLRDEGAQARLRRRIRKKLINFQRKMTVSNAIASRAVLYSDLDAIGYLLFRGPAMYAALHRVFFELSKQLPHFIPKTMLDFGAGTGTAILVAKEVYDPSSLSQPLYRNFRQAMQMNASSQEYQLNELRFDLRRLQRNNEEKKRARFMAVSALLENGEIDPEDLPKDLLREIVAVSKAAFHTAEQRKAEAAQHGRQQALMDEEEWGQQTTDPQRMAGTEDASDIRDGEEENPFGYTDDEGATGTGLGKSSSQGEGPKTWWQKYIDDETSAAADRAQKRLRPLQNITAIEPSPGMMETAMVVLNEEATNVQWKRYLMAEDLGEQHDLTVAAFSLSELSTPEARKKAVQDLWKVTKGVLVIVEHANLHNFDMLMEARDAILEEKDVGLWDWQPTIIGPCPHEKKCPLRYSAAGVKYKRARVCSVDVDYRATFVDLWARESKFKIGYEQFSYLIIARNELVPSRAEQRKLEIEREERRKRAERDRKQRELYENSVPVKDIAFERLSDEALHRPGTDSVPSHTGAMDSSALSETVPTVEDLFDPSLPGNSLSNPVDGSGGEGQLEPPRANSPVSVAAKFPTIPRYTRSGALINKTVFPVNFPPATHRYNRSFIDNGYQSLRPISAGEMITVRHEASVLRNHYQKQLSKYYRIVRQPVNRGKIVGTFCTPEGDLITGRVSRHLYHRSSARFRSSRWATIGGYKLLRRARQGDMFPTDVPLNGIRKMNMLDKPNTLMGTKRSLVEQLGMREGDTVDIDSLDPETMGPEAQRAYTRLKNERESFVLAHEAISEMLGVTPPEDQEVFSSMSKAKEDVARLDATADLTTMDWARVVDAARRNASQQIGKSRPANKPGAPKSRAKRQALLNKSRQRSR